MATGNNTSQEIQGQVSLEPSCVTLKLNRILKGLQKAFGVAKLELFFYTAHNDSKILSDTQKNSRQGYSELKNNLKILHCEWEENKNNLAIETIPTAASKISMVFW